jgi:hypothetical protein
MSMPVCGNIPFELEQLASSMRPVGRDFVSVLKVAHQLGTRVCLRLEKVRAQWSARVELSVKPPTIFLMRHSPVNGERYLDDHEDHLLSPRERFSVAHELGHLVAYDRFHLLPATEKSEYWIQEEWMHRFAATLLTPDSVIDDCLSGLRSGEPVCPFLLQARATRIARLSQEVLATQLCLRRSEIGFMKVALTKRKADNQRILRVLFSTSGDRLRLPKNYSHIGHEHLLSRIEAEGVGSATMRQCVLGKLEPQDVKIVWRRSGMLRGLDKNLPTEDSRDLVPVFWVSVASYVQAPELQLPLW